MRIPIESSTSYRGRNYRPNWLALVGFFALSIGAGAAGDLCLRSGMYWYESLTRPAWIPPAQWFAPVGTVVDLAAGLSVWLVWGERYHRARNAALLSFTVQYCLDAVWAPVFFGMKSIGTALFVVVALWLAVVWTVREFLAVRSAAGWLMFPYLAWTCVAAALNLAIWRANT